MTTSPLQNLTPGLSPRANVSGASGQALTADVRGTEALRARAATDPRGAVREAARQFETLFMQELMKSMRQASAAMDSGMLDNEGSKLGQDMLDTQWAGQMTGLQGGLSEAIARQLERQMGLSPGPIPRPGSPLSTANTAPVNPARPNETVRPPQQAAAQFVAQHAESARRAERESGIPAAFMVAQAAHETGWGRKEIRHADGNTSYNLFGIKAGANWKGATADIVTTEYINGKPQKMVQKFRAYSSYEESFADYAKLMRENPRYERVLAAGADARGFAHGLQRAGYATDPAYADKLTRVINTTLRLKNAVAPSA